MKNEIINSCWICLSLLRQKVKETSNKVHTCHLLFGKQGSENIFINEDACGNATYKVSVYIGSSSNGTSLNEVIIDNKLNLTWSKNNIPNYIANYLTLYLPYCFANIYAKQYNIPYTTSHTAQSLDGCIATNSGHSKWIGNNENLIHAHRMRALCDAVLVGKNTVTYDHPKLNVRHVDGNCPTRVIVGGDKNLDFSSLIDADTNTIIHATTQPYAHSILNIIELTKINGQISLNHLLKKLYYDFAIHSIYIEGGAKLISSFAQNNLLNVMQIHISPMLIGNGMRVASSETIDNIKDAQRFTNGKFFSMANEVMFVGVPK
ncbi:RibD family protein [Candidatus Uabimicrobium sp. HlEnr_7]|uniref:RibD family protein n=1 Tax=Candidatus Uabimicrobium helgolandensis TaxID=3095367 RepID=UPI003556214E